MKAKRKWKIYLIQHSHTDIGYTERQDKIIRYHYDFIRQAIDILDDLHEKNKMEYKGFVWQCENYWQVENFYSMADDSYKKKFEKYVLTGEIGLSGNYLNLNELISLPVLDSLLGDMEYYGKKINHPITAGMSADINGMAWGYADSLYRHGVRYFYSCIHPHHGMFPLYKKSFPFYWESPEGNKILVWNGDYYHLGNELFFAPHGGSTYMVNDEYSKRIRQFEILNTSAQDTYETEMNIVTARLERYLDNFESEEYPYDFIPIMVSGVITDNAPPSGEIARRAAELNEHYKGDITFKMLNLEQFFQKVEEQCADIPVYKGDWTDWWADGVGSTPADVKLYREAIRKHNLCNKLDADLRLGNEQLIRQSEKEMMLYSEHTWGYSSSVSEPWETMVNALDKKKSAYAINANTYIAKNLDQILASKGEVSIRHDRPQVYRIVNPHACAMHTKAYLYIEFWEYISGVRYDCTIPIRVIDCLTGEIIPSQVKLIARAIQVEIEISMQPREERRVRIELAERMQGTTKNHAHIGAEGVEDLMIRNGYRVDVDQIETDHMIVKMNDKKGIYSITNKADGQDIIRQDTEAGAFGGVFEITDIVQTPCETRRRMGRNRKSKATRRYQGVLKDRSIVENGDLYVAVQLDYRLEGTRMYSLFVKVYKQQPKLETMIRIHKQSYIEPENIYAALPFTAGNDTVTYVDKTGCIIRPGIDQLPGSCQDFYLIQNAVAWQTRTSSIAIITKDAPLVSFGELNAKPIVLCDGNDLERNQAPVYSWIMNNFWETNFKVDLGGFYEFSYTMLLEGRRTIEELYQICEAENEGILAYYSE